MSTLYVDTINEKTSGNGIYVPGHVIQVVSDTLTTAAGTNSTTYSDTGLSATITPTSSSSKFLIMTNLGILSTGLNNAILLRLVRNTTEINTGTGGSTYNAHIYGYTASASEFYSYSNHFLDDPSTASAITYKLQFRMTGTTDTGYINRRASDAVAGASSNFTVMEIGG